YVYTLSLHDALPICLVAGLDVVPRAVDAPELLRVDLHDPELLGKVDPAPATRRAIRVLDELLGRRSTQGRPWVHDHLMVTAVAADRKSTRLNSSHVK